MKKIIILILISLFLTACSYKEINRLAIVNAIGIDYIDNNYVISVQVMNLEKKTNDTTQESSILYEGKGPSILSALDNISLEYPNTLYLGHLELLIIGKDIILNNNIDKIFDFFLREPQARTDCLLLMSNKNYAKDIINPKVENKEGTFPSKDIITTIENSKEKNGYIIKQSLEEFIISYYEEGNDIVSTNIILDKDDKEVKTVLTGLLSFKKNKYINELNKDNSFSYNTIKSNYKRVGINVLYNNKPVGISISSKSKIKLYIKDNKPHFDINIYIDGTITELHTNIDFNNDNDYEKIENVTNKYIKDKIDNFLNYSKENNLDLIGLKNIIYKYKYKEYEKYKNENIYEKSIININVKTDIYRYGNISKVTGGNNE